MRPLSKDLFLIVGLGNPGKDYEKTRHNVGFMTVVTIAHRNGWVFKREGLFKSGRIARGEFEGKDVVLFQPGTYMNLSGTAVLRLKNKLNIALEQLLVIADDVALPFGKMRLKTRSSSGGHNGLKSVEESLGTNDYARLRIGVGEPCCEELANYVLSPFTPEEQRQLPEILEGAADVVTTWLTEGLTSAMNQANKKGSSQP